MSAAVSKEEPLVRAVNVTKSFGRHEVLKGVDMTVDGARWSACSARPGRARPPSCA